MELWMGICMCIPDRPAYRIPFLSPLIYFHHMPSPDLMDRFALRGLYKLFVPYAGTCISWPLAHDTTVSIMPWQIRSPGFFGLGASCAGDRYLVAWCYWFNYLERTSHYLSVVFLHQNPCVYHFKLYRVPSPQNKLVYLHWATAYASVRSPKGRPTPTVDSWLCMVGIAAPTCTLWNPIIGIKGHVLIQGVNYVHWGRISQEWTTYRHPLHLKFSNCEA